MIERDVSEKIYSPAFTGLIVHVGLKIEINRIILPFRIHCRKEGIILFEADSRELRELTGVCAYSGRRSHKTCRDGTFERFRLTIGYVESRRHLVGITCRKAARRKSDITYHVGIDHTQTLLLSAADKLRTIQFHSVDIDRVFIKRSATDRILRTHLV